MMVTPTTPTLLMGCSIEKIPKLKKKHVIMYTYQYRMSINMKCCTVFGAEDWERVPKFPEEVEEDQPYNQGSYQRCAGTNCTVRQEKNTRSVE